MNTTESQPEPPGKPRWFQYRLRTLLVLMLLASIVLSWYAVNAQKDGPRLLTTSDDVARYRGHRYRVWFFDDKTGDRVWFFDDKTGAIRGFSDVTLRPQESVRLEPVAGARMELQLQGFMRQSVSDGYRTVEQYDAVSYCLKHRGGGVEGAASIIWPSLDVQRRVAPGCNAIVFCLPVGPKAPVESCSCRCLLAGDRVAEGPTARVSRPVWFSAHCCLSPDSTT